tara:strand:+ start:731 stop:1909 length:1179 start_codon:yes stop_codon:yes gene_type:complete
MNIKDSNIALIHDWFLNSSLGGAEKVTLSIDEFLSREYTSPEIFSLTSNLRALNHDFLRDREIKTSFIQKLPFGKKMVHNYLPLLPFAVEQIDLSEYDLIISSSHAFAKGVITNPYQLHISYVHTPMRYAWDQMYTYLRQSTLSRLGFQLPIRYILYKLREWDFTSSKRIDFLVANSNFTAKRIKKYWNRDSKVIHPPVSVERFDYKKSRQNYYLSVNRLVPNKRIDLLISAFNKLGLPLIIIGDGPERRKLESIANPNIKFLRKIKNSEVEEYMSRCRAFVYSGLEDFGIAPVEAMASGSPVIAFAKGGILDTVNCLINGQKDKLPNGLLFKNQTSDDIVDTINLFEDKKLWKKFNPQELNFYSQNFNNQNFTRKFDLMINKEWDHFQRNL